MCVRALVAIEFDELGGRGFEENDIFYNFLTPRIFFIFIKKTVLLSNTLKKPFSCFKNAFLSY